MKYQYLLALFLALMVFPIVKADGCGIVCPKGIHDRMTLSLSVICNFFTWTFCHIFSLFAMIIITIVVYVFWHYQPEKKRKTVSMFFYCLIGIFFIALLYPYISAWVTMTPSVTATTTTTVPVDTCETFASSTCILSDTGEELNHTPYIATNRWRITCLTLGNADLYTVGNVTLSENPIYIHSGGIYEEVIATDIIIGQNYTVGISQCPV